MFAFVEQRYPALWPYIQLMRLDRPIGTLLLLWPTLWAVWIAGAGTPSLTVIVVFFLGVVIMRAAGCVINDFADRDFDGDVERTQGRPLATGALSAKQALALFCAVVFASTRYVRAFLAKPLFDEILVPGATMEAELAISLFAPKLALLGAIAALTIVVTPIAMVGKLYLAQWVVAQVRRDLDQAVARKLLHISLQHHRTGSSGDLLARAMSDVQIACLALIYLYRDVLQNLLFGVIGVVSMFVTSGPLALLTLTTVPPLLLVTNYFGTRIHRQTQRRQETQGDLSQRLLGILSGIKVIKAFRGYALEETAFASETDRYFKRSLKVVWNRVMAKSWTEVFTQTSGFLVLAVGAWLTLNKLWDLTLGTLMAFAIILMTTYKPVKAITSAYAKVMEALAGASRKQIGRASCRERV